MSLASIETDTANSTTDLLAETQVLIRQNRVSEALDLILTLRASQPRNIFIAGMEKQVRTLVDGENSNATEAAGATLQPLIDRAMESLRSQPASKAIVPVHQVSGKSDRSKAIEALKAQFFAHADRLTKKGDYENALAEIDRILRLDPLDASAREYVQKLDELLALQKAKSMKAHNEGITLHPFAADRPSEIAERKFIPPPASLNELVTMTTTDFDSIIAKTKDNTYSLDLTPTIVPGSQPSEPAPKPNKRTSPLLLASAVFIIFAIVASYFITSMHEAETSEVGEPTVVNPQTTRAEEPQQETVTAKTKPEGAGPQESTAMPKPNESQTDIGFEQ